MSLIGQTEKLKLGTWPEKLIQVGDNKVTSVSFPRCHRYLSMSQVSVSIIGSLAVRWLSKSCQNRAQKISQKRRKLSQSVRQAVRCRQWGLGRLVGLPDRLARPIRPIRQRKMIMSIIGDDKTKPRPPEVSNYSNCLWYDNFMCRQTCIITDVGSFRAFCIGPHRQICIAINTRRNLGT